MDYIQLALLLAIIFLLAAKQTKTKTTKYSGRRLVLDTCALIDGRILDVANAGFTPAQLIIPRFIVSELQLLADGQDAHKRERARFGLDMVKTLQNNAACEVIISDIDFDQPMPTDDKLVKLAKKLSADLCTTDYNLNKVASIEGVRVLNVNELANALRPVVLPGENKQVKIVQKGSNKNQGVGYLEDGTMVVVDNAANSIGKTLSVEVSRFIQTDAGKMIFASLPQSSSSNNRSPKR